MIAPYRLQIRVKLQGSGSFVGWVTVHESNFLVNAQNRCIFDRFNCVSEWRIIDQDGKEVS